MEPTIRRQDAEAANKDDDTVVGEGSSSSSPSSNTMGATGIAAITDATNNTSTTFLMESYLDNLPAYAYMKDIHGNYTYVNRWTERLYNIKRSDLLPKNTINNAKNDGKTDDNSNGNKNNIQITDRKSPPYTDYDFFCKEDADRVTAMDKLVIETGERAEVKHYLAKGLYDNNSIDDEDDDDDSDRKKRSRYLYMTVKFPLRDANGTIVGVCGLSHDVTVQSETETTTHKAALTKSENRFRSLFQHIQNALALHEIIVDPITGNAIDYIFVQVNDAFADMIGLKAIDIVGKKATEVFPSSHAMIKPDRLTLYGQVAQNGAVEQFKEYSQSLKTWHMGLAFRPQANEFVTLFIDITERIEIEEALRQSEERHRTLFESMMQGMCVLVHNTYVWNV
jgi:PAS domain S-box-containing protein